MKNASGQISFSTDPLGFAVAAAALFLGLMLTGCSDVSPVTGQTKVTATTTQSETAGTSSFINGTSRLVVSFNDETPDQNLIVYGPGTRHTKKGRSGLYVAQLLLGRRP